MQTFHNFALFSFIDGLLKFGFRFLDFRLRFLDLGSVFLDLCPGSIFLYRISRNHRAFLDLWSGLGPEEVVVI